MARAAETRAEALKDALDESIRRNGEPQRRDERKRMSVKYDPTINLGHILTFAGFLVTGFTAYSVLERRVSILEEKSTQAVQTAADRASEQRDTIREIRGDVKEMQRSITDLTRAVSGSSANPAGRRL